MVKKRRIPLRKCVVTSEMKSKKDMIRIVRDKEGKVSVDPTGKLSGRGAYVSKDLVVIDQAEKTGVLKRHLNTDIDQHIYDELRQFVDSDE
ncbi:MAG TPA: YlxR family protein [Cerasibacillus sp.]|uniref:RNase P modulator RnpM n=1 Tax=Cerasibacillus sp. TaxID=2498711 RepID=UPI002F3E7726